MYLEIEPACWSVGSQNTFYPIKEVRGVLIYALSLDTRGTECKFCELLAIIGNYVDLPELSAVLLKLCLLCAGDKQRKDLLILHLHG
jgi:hypothetical protein